MRQLAQVALDAYGMEKLESVSYQAEELSMKEGTMNPLSSLTYYRRHRRSALLLVALITLATMVLYTIVGVLDSLTLQLDLSYLSRISRVRPDTGQALEPGVAAQIQSHPDVARVISDNGLAIAVPTLGGIGSMHLMGVSQDDVKYLMAHCGVRLKEGRLLEPRTNEFMLSKEIARALELEIGDRVDRSINETYYEYVLEPLVLVGILEGDPLPSSGQVPVTGSGPSVRVGFVSYEYLDSHELVSSRLVHLLVVPADGRKNGLDAWLEESVASAQTDVVTYNSEYREHQQIVRGLVLVFAVIGGVTAIVAAIAMATLNYIFFTQRQEEFGILHAVGRSRLWLVLRTMKETGSVITVAWLAGAVICCMTPLKKGSPRTCKTPR